MCEFFSYMCVNEHACRVAVRVLSTKLTFIASGRRQHARSQCAARGALQLGSASGGTEQSAAARETAPAARRTARGSRGPRRAPRGGRPSPRRGDAGSRPLPCATTMCPTEMPSTTSYSERSAVFLTSSHRRSS